MRPSLSLAFAFVALVPAAGLAKAPSKTETPEEMTLSKKETRLLLAEFARCTVNRNPRQTSRIILEQIDNDEIVKRFPKAIDGVCMPKHSGDDLMLRMPGANLRYALSDALLARMGISPLSDLSLVAPLNHRRVEERYYRLKAGKNPTPKELAELAEERQRDLADLALSHFGECVVRNSPAQAQRLLRAAPTSAEETQAFNSLKPALSQCIPAGETIKFSRELLRGTVALNYYRLALAPRIAPIGAPK